MMFDLPNFVVHLVPRRIVALVRVQPQGSKDLQGLWSGVGAWWLEGRIGTPV